MIHSPSESRENKVIFHKISPHIHLNLNKSFSGGNHNYEKFERRDSVSSLRSFNKFKESNEKLH